MATSKAKPTDATGRQREKLQHEFAEQQAEAASTMAMATAQKKIDNDSVVIDATSPRQSEIIVDEPTVVDTDSDTVTIRVVESIDSMTFGAGNYYSFEAGKKYKVSRSLARHLEEKGYLAGVI
jgi:hypothetical protein